MSETRESLEKLVRVAQEFLDGVDNGLSRDRLTVHALETLRLFGVRKETIDWMWRAGQSLADSKNPESLG